MAATCGRAELREIDTLTAAQAGAGVVAPFLARWFLRAAEHGAQHFRSGADWDALKPLSGGQAGRSPLRFFGSILDVKKELPVAA